MSQDNNEDHPHQDWKTVLIQGKATSTTIDKKPIVHDKNFLELDSTDPDPKMIGDKISLELRMVIQKARNAKNMTQKELAQSLNIKPEFIQQYECGKAKPDNNLLGKMERILGVKLRGLKK